MNLTSLSLSLRKSIRLTLFPRYRDKTHKTRHEWNEEYRNGRWVIFESLDHAALYGVVASNIQTLKPMATILDLGCGNGVLSQILGKDKFASYLGVDQSDFAISKAEHHTADKIDFVVGDIENFLPPRKVDVIVFNEVLYYLDQPLSIMKRYRSFLNDNGLFIVSISFTEARRTFKKIDGYFELVNEVTIIKKSGQGHICKIYR